MKSNLNLNESKDAYIPIANNMDKSWFRSVENDSKDDIISFQLDDEVFKIKNPAQLLSRFYCIGLQEMQKDITRLLIDLNRLPQGSEVENEIVLLYEMFDFLNDLESSTTIQKESAGSNLEEKYNSTLEKYSRLLEEHEALNKKFDTLTTVNNKRSSHHK